MSVTFTEREAIRKMLDYIEAERERLFNQSLNLLDRLRELDGIEGHTLPEVAEFVQPLLPDYPDIKACNLEDISLQEVFERHTEENPPEELKWEMIPTVETKEDIIPKVEIEALKDKEQKNRPIKNPTRNSKYRDVKVIAQYIKVILKDAGVPIKTAELIKRLKETGVDVSSPYVLIAQATQYEPRIQKAGFGYYQYKW